MSKPTNTDIDFIEVAASLFKHKILIIILVLIGAAGGFTFSVYKTPVFKHNISVKTPVSLASNKAYVENSEVFLILNSLSKDILANKKSASAKYGIAEELAMQIKSINFAQNPSSQSIIDIKLLTYSKESIKNISTFLISYLNEMDSLKEAIDYEKEILSLEIKEMSKAIRKSKKEHEETKELLRQSKISPIQINPLKPYSEIVQAETKLLKNEYILNQEKKFSIVSEALLPMKPEGPGKRTTTAAGLLIGLIIGCFAAITIEMARKGRA